MVIRPPTQPQAKGHMMNETIVAKGLVKHIAEKYQFFGGDLRVMNKAQTKAHGYTQGCATILSEELGEELGTDAPWTYDTSGELLKWVQAKYGHEYWLEAYSSWMLCVNKDTE